MAQNKRVTEETFGVDPKNPSLQKGKIEVFGHMIVEGKPLPNRGISPNVKTGYPANDKK